MLSKPAFDKKPIVLLFLFLLFLFSLLVLRFFQLQVVEEKKWKQLGLKQHRLIVEEEAPRGLFYFNPLLQQEGSAKPIVVNLAKWSLCVDPLKISSSLHSSFTESLGSIISLSKEKTKEHLAKPVHYRKLAKRLSFTDKKKVEEWWKNFSKEHKIVKNALFFTQEYERSYPYGSLLGQVLHTLSYDKDPSTKEAVPTGGLELAFDSYLKGKPAKKMHLRSLRHQIVAETEHAAPIPGADVYLTINHALQTIVEEELEKGVKASKAKTGWAILMDPYTGEIWAMGQYPFFDLREPGPYFSDPLKQESTKFKAVIDPFEPGSTIKPLTMVLGFMANQELIKQGRSPAFSISQKFAVGKSSFPGRKKEITDVTTAKWMRLDMAMQKSSNVYMAKIVQRIVEELGEKWYRDRLVSVFGFGQKVGIELPGESRGLLPSFEKKHPNGAPEWSKATPYSLAIGYNLLATSFQMVRAYAMLANGGYSVHPHIVKKIVRLEEKGDKKILFDWEIKHPYGEREKKIPSYALDPVIHSMRYTMQKGGSGAKAAIPGYTGAGKTGTAEKVVKGTYAKNVHTSTFMGWAPLKHPRFVLQVVMDEPQFGYIPGIGKNHMGSGCCAPVYREIGRRVLAYLGEPPESADALLIQEVEALNKEYRQWNP